LSIFIHVPAGLTHHETSGYSVVMAFWCKVVLLVSLALCQPATAVVFAAATPEQPESVPADEYPFYDLAVEAKFLTSRTRLVIIERMTSTRLHPEEPQLPTVAWFAEQGFFRWPVASGSHSGFRGEGSAAGSIGCPFYLRGTLPVRVRRRGAGD
jgi:hypothetical protein